MTNGPVEQPASALTPEAARAAAEWLESRSPSMAFDLRAEADRLEAAAKTPGQVLAEINEVNWSELPQDIEDNYERSAAAVIAHHVGPDRVVVERFAAMIAADKLDPRRWSATVAEFRKALS